MNKKLKTIIAIIVLVFFVAVLVLSVIPFGLIMADTLQDKLEDSKKTQGKIQGQIDSANSQKKTLLEEKRVVDETITNLQNEISVIQKDIDDCNYTISIKQKELAKAKIDVDNRYAAMKKRMRATYEQGNLTYLNILFQGESIADFISYYELVKELVSYDSNMYKKLVEAKNTIENVKAELEAEQKSNLERKAAVKGKEDAKKAESVKLQVLNNKLDSEIKEFEKAFEQAEKEEQRIREQIKAQMAASAKAGPRTYGGGVFEWPTPGYNNITSDYGHRLHPTLKVYKTHTGIDIGAPYGASIVAAADGVVIISGFNTAWGNYVVINHGSGISTLYAHMSQILAGVGKQVKRGDLIGKVGSTGFSTGAHLHFEVQINGAHVNPWSYL